MKMYDVNEKIEELVARLEPDPETGVSPESEKEIAEAIGELEMDMGEWEMQLYDKIKDPHLQEWYDDYIHQPTTGGESFQQQYTRVAAFLDELKGKPYQRVAIFAHAGVLISAGLYAGLYSWDNAWSNLPDYGEFIVIRN